MANNQWEQDKSWGVLEGILFAAGDPVKTRDLSDVLGVSAERIDSILETMADRYEGMDRGIRLVRAGGSWQMSTKPELYPVIQKVLGLEQKNGLSRAALETLAIIAYRQPVTRVDVEKIRGVSCSSSIQRLTDRELIEEAGRKEAPGRPFYYRTTDLFLRSVHLENLGDLPCFEEFMKRAEKLNLDEEPEEDNAGKEGNG